MDRKRAPEYRAPAFPLKRGAANGDETLGGGTDDSTPLSGRLVPPSSLSVYKDASWFVGGNSGDAGDGIFHAIYPFGAKDAGGRAVPYKHLTLPTIA